MLLPLRDLNPTLRTPVVTYGLILINALVFLYEATRSDAEIQRIIYQWGMVPYWIADLRLSSMSTLVTSMFLHGGPAHLLMNMWSLYIFGDNVEDVLGRVRFVVFYLACGLGAAFAQVLIDPSSTVPMVGASGAISGVMAAYLRLFPQARVITLIFVFVYQVPALLFIVFWFVLQLLSGLGSLGDAASMGGVAFFAHIGGFVVGLYLSSQLRRPQNPTNGFQGPRTQSE